MPVWVYRQVLQSHKKHSNFFAAEYLPKTKRENLLDSCAQGAKSI